MSAEIVKAGRRIHGRSISAHTLSAVAISQRPCVSQLLDQMEFTEQKWGAIHGYLNYQGVPNIATKVRSQEIFLDLIGDSEFAHRFFRHIARTIEGTSKMIQERQRKSGFAADLLSVSNCVINMISPEQ